MVVLDAHLDNGATLVAIFMTKDLSTPGKPLAPMIRLNLDLPDGTSKSFIRTYRADTFSAAGHTADVRIDGNTFVGDHSHYEIDVEIDDLKVSVSLDATILEQETPDGLGFALWEDGCIVGVANIEIAGGIAKDVRLSTDPRRLTLWS